jgi:protein-S-isoprenylcysteine O-methyltransferase Ste14
MTAFILKLVVKTTFWLAFMAALLFVPAGNWRWPEGWAFIAIFTLGSIAFVAWLLKRDPALLASRMGPLMREGQPLWDRIFLATFVTGWCVWIALMALDAQRWRTSHMPVWLEIAGGLLIIAGFAAVMPVFGANSFAAPTVQVQTERGQHVIDTGPYALVRHPMYAASILYLLGMPLLLGSWFGLIGSAIFVLGMSWRATREERTLRHDLAGYGDYMARVRWRLVPYVW